MEQFDPTVLKRKIEESKLKTSEIAEGVPISRTALNDILGGAIPKITTLIGLARVLKTTVAELIGEKSSLHSGLQTITIDTKGEELITTVPYKARAGYIEGLGDKTYIEELPVTILPEKKFKSMTTRCFEISGDSMEPTLRDKDYIYATLVDKEHWQSLKENRVHILVTIDGIVIKRVLNIKEGGYFFCLSDNANTSPFRVFYKDVVEVWEARRRMTADFGRKLDPKSSPYSDEFGLIESEN